MNPDKQRIAIAEACGWTGFEGSGEFLLGVRPQNAITEKALGPRTVTNWTPRDDVPDYLNDLNAMHEAEKVFKCGDHPEDPSELKEYRTNLIHLCINSKTNRDPIVATAAQRAEAFLRTLDVLRAMGKWEEDK